MAKLSLVAVQANRQTVIPATEGKTTIIYAERGTNYQFKHPQNHPSKRLTQKKVNNDLWVFEEGNFSAEPDFILKDYYSHNTGEPMSIADISPEITAQTAATAPTAAPSVANNKALASAMMFTPVALGGIAAIVHSSNKDKDDSLASTAPTTPVTPPSTPPTLTITAKVTIDNIPTINQDTAKGNVRLSGTLTTSDNVASSSVIVTINGKEHTANVNGKVWTLDVLGANLAHAQGTNQVLVKITAKNAQNQTATHTAAGNYFVDTIIDKPVISFHQITGDNIINSLESKQTTTKITGTAKNVNEGDTLTLTIGTVKYSVAIKNGEFAIDVDTLTLVTHKTVTASISTQDTAGNQATTNLSQAVTIDNTAPTKPTISINNITADNIVNANEAKSTIKVTGTSNAEAGSSIIVRCVCTACSNAKLVELPARVKNDGSFEVTFRGEDIKSADTIVVVSETDISKNIEGSQASKSYTVDITAPAVTLSIDDITADNVINANEAKNNTFTLKGTLSNLGEDERIESIKVMINGKSHTATVSNQTYQVNVNTSDLLADNVVQVATLITDLAGNEQIIREQKTYTIDTNIPTGSIQIVSVAENNVINQHEFGKKVAIIGKVTGQFNLNDTVNISIDGRSYTTTITNANGDFSLSIDADTLKDANTKQITATITTTNDIGNSATYSTKSPFSYTAETPPLDLQITLEKISGDNLINVSEAKDTVNVTGRVSGKDLKPSHTVDLFLGDTRIAANIGIDSDGKFYATIAGTDLVNTQGHTLIAKITQENGITHSLPYTVHQDASAQIDILKIDSDNSIDQAQSAELVRIDGTVSFNSGTYSTANNLKLVRTVDVAIGTEVYSVGVRDGKFSLDIPADKLTALDSKALSYTFKAEPWRFVNGQALGYNNEGAVGHDDNYQTDSPYFVVQSPIVTLTSPHIATKGGQDVIQAKNTTSIISGTVSGVAKVNDDIEITVNGQTYQTKVLAGNRFETTIATADLHADMTKIVKAALFTTDLSGQKISVTDQEVYAQANVVTGDFVPTHINTVAADEYFVRDLGVAEVYKDVFGTNVTPAYNINVGGSTTGKPAVIKYYFAQKSDYNPLINDGEMIDDSGRQSIIEDSIGTHPDDIKKIIRQAYDQLEHYLNVKFEEVYSLQESDTNHFYADFTSQDPNIPDTLAFAYNSGSLWWNAKAPITNTSDIMYTALHEIGHNLNMTHSGTEQGRFTKDPRNFEETAEFTYMSYRSTVNNNAFQYLKNLRMYDLAYLHFQLGVNKDYNPDNDIYTFKEYNMFSDTADRYIWDGGGVDTFNAANEQRGVNVNLTPGSWIYVGDQPTANFAVASQKLHADEQYYITQDESFYAFYHGGLTENTYTVGQAFIGYGTQIENLVGSAHNDILTGNDADNIIFAGAGNDTIHGGLGDDYLDGGLGIDTMSGGKGNDTYVVDHLSDKVTEHNNEGYEDWIYSSVNYTLPAQVEHIGLFGDIANQAIGNALDNALIANNIGNTLKGMGGDDTLIGGLGADILDGGLGADTYVFNSALNGNIDTLIMDIQDKIALSADVFVGLIKDKTDNLDKLLNYNQDTGTLSYDQDGAGEIDAIAFAKIEGDFTFSIDKFTVI